MTLPEFSVQLDRLRNVYGDKFYPDERIKILWEEIKGFPMPWLDRVVSLWIGDRKDPPLMPQFREEMSKERERTHFVAKKEQSKDAREIWSTLSGDEIQNICGLTRRRMAGGMNDIDWSNFQKTLKGLGR